MISINIHTGNSRYLREIFVLTQELFCCSGRYSPLSPSPPSELGSIIHTFATEWVPCCRIHAHAGIVWAPRWQKHAPAFVTLPQYSYDTVSVVRCPLSWLCSDVTADMVHMADRFKFWFRVELLPIGTWQIMSKAARLIFKSASWC